MEGAPAVDPKSKGPHGGPSGHTWRGEGAPQVAQRRPCTTPRGPWSSTALRPPSLETSGEMFDYIVSLPPPVPLSLMASPIGCCCCFRTLSAFDRHVLLRLLPLQQSVSERAMRLWVSPGSVAELRRSLQRLTAARFIRAIEPAAAAAAAGGGEQQGKSSSSSSSQQRFTQYALTPSFQKALLHFVLEGPPRAPLAFIACPPKEAFPSKEVLLLHSQRKWERLLRFVVGASEETPQTGSSTEAPASPDLLKILHRKRLLCQESPSKGPTVQQQQQYYPGSANPSSSMSSSSSSSGALDYVMAREAFSWLLQDLRAQLSSLLLEFLYVVDGGILSNAAYEASLRCSSSSSSSSGSSKAGKHSHSSSSGNRGDTGTADAPHDATAGASATLIEAKQQEMQEILLLLTALAESCVGQPFSLSHLTRPQRRLMNLCVDLGIAWVPPRKGGGSHHGGAPKGSKGSGKGASSGAPSLAFAAPYVLLIRREAHNPLAATSYQGGPQVKAAGPGASGAPGEPSNNVLDGHGGPPRSDAASVMEGPFHPWLAADGEEKRGLYSPPAHPGGSWKVSAVSTFGSLGLQPAILVETNFKVYMYTASPLHVSVLAHLCELTARLPNLVVGLLTRASVLGALKAGITAEQIIGFLEAHAHAVAVENTAKHNKPLIPENVAIQLRMWQQERQRLSLFPAVVFKGWDAALLPELFQRSVRWAVAKNCALHYTMWPEDSQSPQFAQWMTQEKYLAVHADSKPEIVARIREIRDELLAQRAGGHPS